MTIPFLKIWSKPICKNKLPKTGKRSITKRIKEKPSLDIIENIPTIGKTIKKEEKIQRKIPNPTEPLMLCLAGMLERSTSVVG